MATSLIQTARAIDLYVATDGDDANPGTEDKPFRQPQAALDYVMALSHVIRHPVKIHIGAGEFEGFVVSGFTFGPPTDRSVGAYLQILGADLADVTPTTGVASGVVTAFTTGATTNADFGTVEIDNAGWTTDDLIGKLVEVTDGDGEGSIYAIWGNTDDTITIVGRFSPAVAIGSTIAIREPATIISGAVSRAAAAEVDELEDWTSILVENCIGLDFNSGLLRMDRLLVRPTTTSFCVTAMGMGALALNMVNCVIDGRASSVSVGVALYGSLLFRLEGGTIHAPTGSSRTGILQGTTGFMPTNIILTQALITGGTIGISAGNFAAYTRLLRTGIRGFSDTGIKMYSTNGQVATSGSRILGTDGSSIGVNLYSFSESPGTAPKNVSLSDTDVSDCATAVYIGNPFGFCYGNRLSGTGNGVGLRADKGSRVQLASTVTLTGTTELSIDGTSSDLATMRAASPKHVKNDTYGTIIYE